MLFKQLNSFKQLSFTEMYLKTCSTDIYQLQTIQLYEIQLKDQNNDEKKKLTMNTVNER